LLARRAAIEFLLHFFRATVDARESQSRDRAGSRQAAARVFLHQIFALVTPIFFQVVVDKVLTHKGYSTLYVLVAGLVLIGLFDAVLQYLRLTGQERADVLKLAHARDRLARSPRLK
jgi:ABC-type protease/lipase transport system fused ATPase/permease subunit